MSLFLLGAGLAAFAAARSMRALLFGVPPIDPATVVLALGICVAMAVAGACVPALRATRVSPMSVMRAE